VNQLAIENKGNLPVLVLAGTIVKGGRQDRQIGQDFVVPPGATVPVQAYCVEHGRWQPDREGKDTYGRFETVGVLAMSEVRTAGQYENNQGKVWQKVEETNASTRKSAPSGTLLASVGDQSMGGQRNAVAQRVAQALAKDPARESAVGLAYAVDGRVLGARWFKDHALFELNLEVLVNTAAMEAVTAKSAALEDKRSVEDGSVAAESVAEFVNSVQESQVERTERTSGGNQNEYRKAVRNFGSSTFVNEGGTAVPVTSDFSAGSRDSQPPQPGASPRNEPSRRRVIRFSGLEPRQ